jgi:hypothetical protein
VLRGECWDHLIPVDGRQPRTVVAQHLDHLNTVRPRRTLRLETRLPAARSPARAGAVAARPVVADLHHVYARAA